MIINFTVIDPENRIKKSILDQKVPEFTKTLLYSGSARFVRPDVEENVFNHIFFTHFKMMKNVLSVYYKRDQCANTKVLLFQEKEGATVFPP
jgi:hypothetical protein